MNNVTAKTAARKPGRRIPFRALAFSMATALLVLLLATSNSGCGIYKLKDISIPDSIRTVKVAYFENRASYVNPTLGARLADKLRQKVVSQTRLKQTNGDDADWDISAVITGYSFTTSGISNQQVATNRLTVTVQVTKVDNRADKTDKYDISRNFDFAASQTIQQAEAGLADEMIRGITDDIFNRLFSDW